MQVPPDLASRLSNAAAASGRTPEAFLREAISRLIDATPASHPVLEQAQQGGFVPQRPSFSVYE